MNESLIERILKVVGRFIPLAVLVALMCFSAAVIFVGAHLIRHPGRELTLAGYKFSIDGASTDPSTKLGWSSVAGVPKTLSTHCEYRFKIQKTPTNDVFLYPSIVEPQRIGGITADGENFWYQTQDVPGVGYKGGMVRSNSGDTTAVLQERCKVPE